MVQKPVKAILSKSLLEASPQRQWLLMKWAYQCCGRLSVKSTHHFRQNTAANTPGAWHYQCTKVHSWPPTTTMWDNDTRWYTYSSQTYQSGRLARKNSTSATWKTSILDIQGWAHYSGWACSQKYQNYHTHIRKKWSPEANPPWTPWHHQMSVMCQRNNLLARHN